MQNASAAAFCSSCNSLSLNTKNCEKCGAAVTQDQGIYGSQAKRARVDAPTSTIISGTMQTNVMMNGARPVYAQDPNLPGPVPQGLYRNANMMSNVAQNAAQPRSLYMSLNSLSGTQMQQNQQRLVHQAPQSYANTAVSSYNLSTQAAMPTQPPQYQRAELKYNLEALQIRIGTCKFTPDTSVTFKNEGVLFSLRDYSRAPVLLNARAIVKCKVNFGQPFPAFFFHLEASCIRQLQHIFNLSVDTFTDQGKNEHNRYITIFPTKMTEADKVSIRRVFDNMRDKYKWTSSKLVEINSTQVLEIIWPATLPRGGTTQTQPATSSQSTRSAPTHPAVNGNVAVRQANVRQQLPAPPPLASNQQRHPSNGQHQVLSNFVNPASGQPNVQLLKIPNDHARWKEMQRSLVVNQLYRVEMPNKETQFCIWNGKDLKQCQTQDSGVMLECTHVRVGSLKAQPVGVTHVRGDPVTGGISFKIKLGGVGQMADIAIPTGCLEKCEVCFHERLFSMFIRVVPSQAATIRTKCRMGKHDPTYNPQSQLERQKHIHLSFKNINKEQKATLLKMRRQDGLPMIQEINLLAAMAILADIKQDSRVQSKISAYMKSANNADKDVEETLNTLTEFVKDSLSDGDTKRSGGAVDDDDDDDDIIMTEEEVGIKCCYTQMVMKNPVRNKNCGHNYEKDAIYDFIRRRMSKPNADKNPAKCPYAGCVNQIPLIYTDLEDNTELKEHIEKTMKKS